MIVAKLYYLFLNGGKFLERYFNAHIAASNHCAVATVYNLTNVIHALAVFYFGYNLNVFAAVGAKQFFNKPHVASASNKANRQIVGVLRYSEKHVFAVYVGYIRHIYVHARQIYALSVAELAAVRYNANDFVLRNRIDFKFYKPVVQ